jgi:hypothetical protein
MCFIAAGIKSIITSDERYIAEDGRPHRRAYASFEGWKQTWRPIYLRGFENKSRAFLDAWLFSSPTSNHPVSAVTASVKGYGE